ncbi:MAG TPA: carbohydrate kinase family protein [Candidatus Limnocylindrales bacterium]|nr:carbohydrate kinase family protein [Candidatus Limnocylindrales bacterium]
MDIIVTGSIAYDYLMRFPGRFTDHFIKEALHQVSLSFLVEDMTRHWGGVAANIAYSMALFGLHPKLMGTVGRDFEDYRRWLDEAGVDTSTVRLIDQVFCSSFFVNTDLENNQIASFYSGAMAYAKNYPISEAYDGKPDLVLISPNDPQAMQNLAEECRQRGLPFIYDPSQQVPRLNGDELRQSMAGAYMMIVNAYEATMICEKTALTVDQLRDEVEVLVITQGKDGSHIYTGDGLIEVPVAPVDSIKDPTGVGDAFRAGLICGVAHGLPWKTAGEMGSLCAAYVLEQVGPQSHRFSIDEFIRRFRATFNDEGLLDRVAASQAAQV